MKQYAGLYEAIVLSNIDPTGKSLLTLQIPAVTGREVFDKVPLCFPPVASVTSPAIGSTVWVMFEQGSPAKPIWMGLKK